MMIYKPFHDLNISHLGMGNMRLPTVGGERSGPIDQGKARAIIEYAYELGQVMRSTCRPAFDAWAGRQWCLSAADDGGIFRD